MTRLELAAGDTEITATVRTQRERGASFFAFERAPDLAGVPGVFADYDSAGAGGDSSLADPANRADYTRVWSVPGNERGVAFWYRAGYTEGGVRYVSPARRFVSPLGPSVAMIEVTLVHNAYDHDVTATVVVGDPKKPDLTIALPGSGAATSSDWVSGVSTTGNVSWTFRVPVPAGAASSLLPPTPDRPWTLRVQEGGYLNRSGRVTSFRLTYHWPHHEVVYEGDPVPQQTVEGGTVSVTIPNNLVGVGEARRPGLRIGPNPVRAGSEIRFAADVPLTTEVRIFDLTGRSVGRVALAPAGDSASGAWTTRDAGGHPLTPGIYLARLSSGEHFRLVVLPR